MEPVDGAEPDVSAVHPVEEFSVRTAMA